MEKHSNLSIVVTGGASGIGYGIAEKCVKSGMHLVVADLKLPDIEKAIKDLSRHANGDQKIVPLTISAFFLNFSYDHV